MAGDFQLSATLRGHEEDVSMSDYFSPSHQLSRRLPLRMTRLFITLLSIQVAAGS